MLKWTITFFVNRAMIALGAYLVFQAAFGLAACQSGSLANGLFRMVSPYDEILRNLR